MKLIIKEDAAGRYEWDEHIDGSYSVRDRFENKYVTAYKVLGKPVRYTIKQSDETDLNYFGQQIPHKYTKHEVEKSIERFGVPEKTFADISESWCDDKLDQLYAKGKANWDQDDWEDYVYCQNANAERDYYDSLDEDIEDNKLESATLTEFTNIVFDTLLQNTQYPQLDLDKLNEFDDEMDDFAQVDAKRGKIDIGYDGHIYEISIKELK